MRGKAEEKRENRRQNGVVAEERKRGENGVGSGTTDGESEKGAAADPVASRQARGARVETASEPETQAPCSLM